MADKKRARLRRARKTRARIYRSGDYRLSVFRTPRHIYAQIFNSDGSRVLASASTVNQEVRDALGQTGNIEAAKTVGRLIAERGLAVGVDKVAFDRSGYQYHGRVQALADSAREAGLRF